MPTTHLDVDYNRIVSHHLYLSPRDRSRVSHAIPRNQRERECENIAWSRLRDDVGLTNQV